MTKDMKKNSKAKSEVILNEYSDSINSDSTNNKQKTNAISYISDKLSLSPLKQTNSLGSNSEMEGISFFDINSSDLDAKEEINNNDHDKKDESNLFTYSNLMDEGVSVNINTIESNLVLNESKFLVNFQQHNMVVLDYEISTVKKLVMQDEEGDILGRNKLVIDASGLQNCLRKKRDGFSFFGTTAKYKNKEINDFILNWEDNTTLSIFAIYFDRRIQKYYFKNCVNKCNNLPQKSLIFTKLSPTNIITLSSKEILQFGQFLVYILTDEEKIKINIYYTTNTPLEEIYSDKTQNFLKSYLFFRKDCPVTIGRNNCKINLDSNYLSKNHCTIDNLDNNWVLSDGYKSWKSKNGIWMFVNKKLEISNKTQIRIGTHIFSIDYLL